MWNLWALVASRKLQGPLRLPIPDNQEVPGFESAINTSQFYGDAPGTDVTSAHRRLKACSWTHVCSCMKHLLGSPVSQPWEQVLGTSGAQSSHQSSWAHTWGLGGRQPTAANTVYRTAWRRQKRGSELPRVDNSEGCPTDLNPKGPYIWSSNLSLWQVDQGLLIPIFQKRKSRLREAKSLTPNHTAHNP